MIGIPKDGHRKIRWCWEYHRFAPNSLTVYHTLCSIIIYKPLLGGGFKELFVSPLPGEMIQFDEHAYFSDAWSNHHRMILFLEFIEECNYNILLMEEILHHLGCIKPYK